MSMRSSDQVVRRKVSLRRQALEILAVRVVGAFGQAILLAITARQLEVRDFGTLAALLGASAVCLTLCDLGVVPTILRAESNTAGADKLPGLYRLLLVTTGLLIPISLTVGFIASKDAVVSAAFVGFCVGERLIDSSNARHVAHGLSSSLASVTVLRRLTPILLVIGVWKGTGHVNLESIMACLGVSALTLGLIWQWRAVRLRRPIDNREIRLRGTLAGSFPFWINSVGMQLRQLDTMFVAGVGTPSAAALFGAISRLVAPLRMLPTAFAQATVPHSARSGKSGIRRTLAELRSVLILSAGLYLLVGIFADDLLAMLFGARYAEGADALRILLIGLTVAGAVSTYNSILLGVGDEWFAALSSLASGLLALGLVTIGAATGGIVVAAAGLSLSFCIHLIPLLWRVHWVHGRQFAAERESSP